MITINSSEDKLLCSSDQDLTWAAKGAALLCRLRGVQGMNVKQRTRRKAGHSLGGEVMELSISIRVRVGLWLTFFIKCTEACLNENLHETALVKVTRMQLASI